MCARDSRNKSYIIGQVSFSPHKYKHKSNHQNINELSKKNSQKFSIVKNGKNTRKPTKQAAMEMSSELASDLHFDSARSADELSKILEELKHEFVCSSCKANLLPPVKTCQNGHKICEKCKMYSNCAKCDLATKRVLHNVELENGRAKVNM